jgi:hypothetical protein
MNSLSLFHSLNAFKGELIMSLATTTYGVEPFGGQLPQVHIVQEALGHTTNGNRVVQIQRFPLGHFSEVNKI